MRKNWPGSKRNLVRTMIDINSITSQVLLGKRAALYLELTGHNRVVQEATARIDTTRRVLEQQVAECKRAEGLVSDKKGEIKEIEEAWKTLTGEQFFPSRD